MTKQEVLELIAKYIIRNGDGAITATVLQPILEQMVLQPNMLIGRLELLNTTQKDTLVDAINSIITMDIVELVNTVEQLVEASREQENSINEIESSVTRLDTEKADKIDTYSKHEVDSLIENVEVDLSEYAKKEDVDLKLERKADKSDTFTKEEVIFELGSKANISDIPTKVSDLENDSNFTTENQILGILENYGTKVYIAEQISEISKVTILVVDELPLVGESNVIYLVPSNDSNPNNNRDEYIYLNGDWEKIGSTDIDLSEYSKTDNITLDLVLKNNNISSEPIIIEALDGKKIELNNYGFLVRDEEDNTLGSINVLGTHIEISYKDSTLKINENDVEINKPLVLPDAILDTQAPNLGQVKNLMPDDISVGFGLSKDEEGKIRIGTDIGSSATLLDTLKQPFIIGYVSVGQVRGIQFDYPLQGSMSIGSEKELFLNSPNIFRSEIDLENIRPNEVATIDYVEGRDVILTAPNDNKFKLIVSNDGVLSTIAVS